MSKPVTKVVVVGGGAAGWITAGIVAAEHDACRETGIDVVLGSVHVGLGYEFLKFYKVKVDGKEGSTSDRCIGFFMRLGYTYH